MGPRETLDAFLERRNASFEGVVIGGAALNLLGVVSRATRDCDVLDPEISPEIADAARSFATEGRASGGVLQDSWLNNGPRALLHDLPEGRRDVASPVAVPDQESLTAALVAIGFNLAARPARREPNIEDTLFFAAVEGMERADLRVLALLVTWVGIHAPWVNADRLTRLVVGHPSDRVRAFWAALARWQAADRRFARLADAHRGPRVPAVSGSSEFLLRRHGEDPRFEGSPLVVAATVLRDRPEDVLTPAALAARHSAYRLRVMIGPSYRADMWAALARNAKLSAADLARETYGSFATAWRVKRDFALIARQSKPRRMGAR